MRNYDKWMEVTQPERPVGSGVPLERCPDFTNMSVWWVVRKMRFSLYALKEVHQKTEPQMRRWFSGRRIHGVHASYIVRLFEEFGS